MAVTPSRLSRWAPPAIYGLAIFLVSSTSNPPAPPGALTDKHVHALIFGGLAMLLLRALSPRWPAVMEARPALGAIVMTVAYGASDEWHQAFVPGRYGDLADLVADAAGAILAMLLAWAYASWRAARHRPVAAGEL